MSLPLVFNPAARLELEEAVAWYEAQRPGLGRKFATEVKLALDLLEDFAEDHGNGKYWNW